MEDGLHLLVFQEGLLIFIKFNLKNYYREIFRLATGTSTSGQGLKTYYKTLAKPVETRKVVNEIFRLNKNYLIQKNKLTKCDTCIQLRQGETHAKEQELKTQYRQHLQNHWANIRFF